MAFSRSVSLPSLTSFLRCMKKARPSSASSAGFGEAGYQAGVSAQECAFLGTTKVPIHVLGAVQIIPKGPRS